MKWHKPRTIYLSRILIRLAIEDASMQAVRAEMTRQIAEQMPGFGITVGGCEIYSTQIEWPTEFECNPPLNIEWVD